MRTTHGVMYGVSLVAASLALVLSPAVGCVDPCGSGPFERREDPTPQLLEGAKQAMQTYRARPEGGVLSVTLTWEPRAQSAWAIDLISSAHACSIPLPSAGFDANMDMTWTPEEGVPWTLTNLPMRGAYTSSWGSGGGGTVELSGDLGNLRVRMTLWEVTQGEFMLTEFLAQDSARDVQYAEEPEF